MIALAAGVSVMASDPVVAERLPIRLYTTADGLPSQFVDVCVSRLLRLLMVCHLRGAQPVRRQAIRHLRHARRAAPPWHEDQPQIRAGLAALISHCRDTRAAVTINQSKRRCRQSRGPPDVALVDIGLPGMSGIDGTCVFRERFPGVQVLVLTIYDDDDRIFEAICAGACGYLLKKEPAERLLESIREVAAGGSPMSPEVARRVLELFRRVQPPPRVDYQLTPHELRLLRMLVDGHNYKTAAVELKVSVNTVSFHIRKIYDKLQVHSRSAAVAKALRNHLA